MNYPDIPPLELLNQLAPNVKKYLLNKVNRYYEEEIKEEHRREVEDFISSSETHTFTDIDGKIITIEPVQFKDIKAIEKLAKED